MRGSARDSEGMDWGIVCRLKATRNMFVLLVGWLEGEILSVQGRSDEEREREGQNQNTNQDPSF